MVERMTVYGMLARPYDPLLVAIDSNGGKSCGVRKWVNFTRANTVLGTLNVARNRRARAAKPSR